MARQRLGDVLVEAGVIDEIQLKAALGEQKKWGRPLGRTLVEMKLIKEDVLLSILSKQLSVATIDLKQITPDKTSTKFLSFDFCMQYHVLPFKYEESGKFLHIAMTDPTNLELFDRIRVVTRCNIRPFLAGPKTIEDEIRAAYLGTAPSHYRATPSEQVELLHNANEIVLDSGNYDAVSRNKMPAAKRESSVHAGMQRPSYDSSNDQIEIDIDDDDDEETIVGNRSAPDLSLPSLADPNDDLEIESLRSELKEVRAMLQRDELVLRKLMSLIVQKGVCTREELVARLQED